jgi:hypothetical protein
MDQVTEPKRLWLLWLIIFLLSVSCSFAETKSVDPLAAKITALGLDNQTIFDGFAKLSQIARMGFSVEKELTRKAHPVLPPVLRFTATVKNVSLAQALDWLCKLDARYAWTSDGYTVNLFPRDIRNDPTYVLNQKISPFGMEDTASVTAAVIQAGRHASPPQQIAVMALGNTQYPKPTNLTFSNVSLREALNQIARSLGPTYGWQFSGTEEFHYVVFHDYLIPSESEPDEAGRSKVKY